MLLLIMVSLVQMIWESYFIISRLFRHAGHGPVSPADVLLSLRNALFIFMATKRLVHLTGLVHEFHKRLESVEEKLIENEVSGR